MYWTVRYSGLVSVRTDALKHAISIFILSMSEDCFWKFSGSELDYSTWGRIIKSRSTKLCLPYSFTASCYMRNATWLTPQIRGDIVKHQLRFINIRKRLFLTTKRQERNCSAHYGDKSWTCHLKDRLRWHVQVQYLKEPWYHSLLLCSRNFHLCSVCPVATPPNQHNRSHLLHPVYIQLHCFHPSSDCHHSHVNFPALSHAHFSGRCD